METQSTRSANRAGGLRDLKFETLEEAVMDARQLLASGYVQHGKWNLGQICWHLRTVQDASIDGYPWYFSLFAPLRPFFRWKLLNRVLNGDSPRGIPTNPLYVASNEVDDADEVDAFAKSVDRFLNHQGKLHAHPGFGNLDRETFQRVYAGHAAHHLRFLESPNEA